MEVAAFFKKATKEGVDTLIKKYEDGDLGDCCVDIGEYFGGEYAYESVCIHELKPYLESVKIVDNLGGLKAAEKVFEVSVIHAIGDYEEIYGDDCE